MGLVANGAGKLRIAIIGGGIGGLALALGLQHYEHLEVHVYESKPKFAEVGAAVTMMPTAIWALETISPETKAAVHKCLSGSIDKNGVDEPARVYAGTGVRAGEFLGHLQTSNRREGVKNVHRASFLAELAAGLRPEIAHLEARAIRISDQSEVGGSVRVEFADGSAEDFDAVIGADGIRSVVRKSLFEEGSTFDEPAFANMIIHRGLVPMEDAVAVFGQRMAEHPSFSMGPGHVLFNYPTELGQKANLVAMSYQESLWEEENWIVPGKREELEEMLKDWGNIGRKWIQLLDTPGLSKWSIWETPPLPFFAHSCVAITGDAAHAMVPMAGSGGGSAFEDMAVLTALFAHVHTKRQIPHALAAYDLERRARGQKAVRTSREMMMKGTFMVPGGTNENLMDHLTGTLDWIVSRDVEDQNQHAVKLFWESLGGRT